MIDKYKFKKLAELFGSTYNKNELVGGMGRLAKNFIKKNTKFCLAEQVPEELVNFGLKSSMPKVELEIVSAIPFLNENLFIAFRESLPADTRAIFDLLIWQEEVTAAEIEEQLGFVIYTKEERWGNSYSYDIKGEYNYLSNWLVGSYFHHSYYRGGEIPFKMAFPMSFRKIVSDYYEKPKEAAFIPLTEIDKTDYTYCGEENMFIDLPKVLAYANQGNIRTTTTSKPQTSTLAKMQRKLKLAEFYEDTTIKELKYVRTNLLAALISAGQIPEQQLTIAEQLKVFIEDNYVYKLNVIDGILGYIKGNSATVTYHYYVKSATVQFYEIFKQLPLNKWISLENVANFIKYNFYNVKPIAENGAYEKLYFSYDKGYSYRGKHYIRQEDYHKFITQPLIQGTCFLFAAYGLLDVAYNSVAHDDFVLGDTVNSPYNGLKYLRLNKLGAYVLSLINDYEAPSSITKSSINLSTDSLTIIIDEEDVTAPIILDPFAQRVSPNRFSTDFAFFLKGIQSQEELVDKIDLFKRSIRVPLPPNWQQFFKELKQKIEPLKRVKGNTIFQIPSDNTELLQLIAKDPKLKQLCLKAEGYHIIVAKKNMANFKKRLQEFGYLIE